MSRQTVMVPCGKTLTGLLWWLRYKCSQITDWTVNSRTLLPTHRVFSPTEKLFKPTTEGGPNHSLIWRADSSTLLFTANSVLRGLARSQHAGMLQLIHSFLKNILKVSEDTGGKEVMGLPLKRLPFNSQIHDIAKIHLVVSGWNSIWMRLYKKQWSRKITTKSNVLEWFWNISLHFSKSWTKHSGFLHGSENKVTNFPNSIC